MNFRNYMINFSVVIIFAALLITPLFFPIACIEGTSGAEVAVRGPSTRALAFTDASTGLPTDGDYNYIALGDINSDGYIDMAFGGEDYSATNSQGLYVYTGNGGTSWSDASSGLPTANSWGGLQLVDADSDGYMELYATDEPWGTHDNQGLKVWEYRSGSWTDSASYVSSPFSSGTADNVIIDDITGDDKLDLLLCKKTGLEYYENGGGNPVNWVDKSNGLPSNPEFTAAAVADMNGDGLKDIAVSDYSNKEYLFVQHASGTLWSDESGDLAAGGNTLGITVGDVNGDSYTDIAFGDTGSGITVLLGDGGGSTGGTAFSWNDGSTGLPTSNRYCQLQLVDIDGDGDLDLLAPATTGNDGIQLFLGNGNSNPGDAMTWTEATNTNLPTGNNWCGVNYYDINGDGHLDVLGASWGEGAGAYLNTGGSVIVTDDTAPGKITDLKIDQLSADGATLTWTASGDDDTTGTASTYDIRYSESAINDGTWSTALKAVGEGTPKAAGEDESFHLSDLDQNTTYHFAVRAADEVPNWSLISNIPTGQTLGVSKPELTVTLAPSKTTADSGETITLDVLVLKAEDQSALSDADVELSSDTTGVSISPTTGTTDDDGKLHASVTMPMLSSGTDISLMAMVTRGGYKSSYVVTSVTVNAIKAEQKYNLRITDSDITLSEEGLKAGDVVTISAVVRNSGSQDATGFAVRFYVDTNTMGTDKDYTQLPKGGQLTVERAWTATEGTHIIKVEILPSNAAMDSDGTDNIAQISVTVGAADSTGDGKDDDDKSGGLGASSMILIVVIIVIIVIVLMLVMAGKKNNSQGGKPPGDERVEK